MALSINEGGRLRQVTPGSFHKIVGKALDELRAIAVDDRLTAWDIFQQYYDRLAEPHDLTDFHCVLRTILLLYTDDRFFRALNARWRDSRSMELLGVSTLMSMAFRHAAYFMEGEVFRGATLSDAADYKPGLIFRWPFFVSASTDAAVAREFGDILMVIEVPGWANVRDIAYLSLYPDECEVLFRAYEIFEVLKVDDNEIRLRVFEDAWFGTGWEVLDTREVVQIT